MSLLRQCLDFFLEGSSVPQQQAFPTAPSPTPAPAPPPVKPDNGHIRRKRFAIRQLGSDGTIDESENRWHENNGVMEGEEITVRVESASGEIVEPSALTIRCSVCGREDNCIIRSAKSHLPLCRLCQRTFEQPDGTEIIVTPLEKLQLKEEFNTWEYYDTQAKRVPR